MALVVPGPDEDVAVIAGALLAMADSPADVQTTMDGPFGLAFIVPDGLGHKWACRGADPVEVVVEEPAAELDGASEVPKKRGPGRPRKVTELDATEE